MKEREREKVIRSFKNFFFRCGLSKLSKLQHRSSLEFLIKGSIFSHW